MVEACDYDPGEAPHVRVLYDGAPVARCGHRCDQCPYDRYIAEGTRYAKAVLLVDGELIVRRSCLGGGCWPEHEAATRQPPPEALGPDDLPF